MCRPCTGIEDANVIPQELAAFADDGSLAGYFQKSSQFKAAEWAESREEQIEMNW